MKKFRVGLLVLLLVSLVNLNIAIAEPTGPATKTSSSVEVGVGQNQKLAPPVFDFQTAAAFTRTADYENQVVTVQDLLNQLSPAVAELRGQSGNTIMKGNDKTFPRLTSVCLSVMDNLLGVVENYKPLKDTEIYSIVQKMRKRLRRVDVNVFGPDCREDFEIYPVSNEGKGEVDVVIGYTDGVDEVGNPVRSPVLHKVRYIVMPGLTATKQNEREVAVIDRLPDGEYKIAIGIFYAGQDKVTMSWDPRTYTRVDYFLQYHNACSDQIAWASCAKSKCVKFSQNKTVNTK